MISRSLVLALLLIAGPARADDDEAALSLADKAPAATARAGPWRVVTEGAISEFTQRGGDSTDHSERLSLDAHYDKRLSSDWRAIFANRLDVAWRNEITHDDFVNTLKEAYLSFQPQPDGIFDLGRVNLRNGVASGYNPTDYFRAGAVRSVVSINPASLRENRLGSVMLRGQALWTDRSLTALYSPKLADEPNNSAFSPDIGATNQRNRWLLALSERLSDSFNPQVLLYGEDGRPPQVGANLTALFNDATVAYLEWSGGRSPSLVTQALGLSDDSAFRSRLATGLTYTTTDKLSLTLEYEYNGAGLDRADWDALRSGSPAAYGQYRRLVQNLQDLPTRKNIFFYAHWQDALVVHLDLSAMERFDTSDHSRLHWLEGRYHWDHVDLALQWQLNAGDASSEFGALTQRRIWQALVTYFF